MANPMIERIESRLAELNLKPRAASLKVSTNADLIRGVLRAGDNANPTRETLEKIAEALDVTPEWLLGAADAAPPSRAPGDYVSAPVRLPSNAEMPKNLQVWGTAQGSLVDGVEGLSVYTGQPVDMVRRPPALMGVPDAYGIYVTGDSMDPMHPHGALRMVHPGRPPSPGDSVIVVTKHWAEDPGQGYIKILRRRNGDRLVLEQLNPRATIEIPMKYVVSVHKVLDLNDLFGV